MLENQHQHFKISDAFDVTPRSPSLFLEDRLSYQSLMHVRFPVRSVSRRTHPIHAMPEQSKPKDSCGRACPITLVTLCYPVAYESDFEDVPCLSASQPLSQPCFQSVILKIALLHTVRPGQSFNALEVSNHQSRADISRRARRIETEHHAP